MRSIFLIVALLLCVNSSYASDLFQEWLNLYQPLLEKYVVKGKKRGIYTTLVDYDGLRSDSDFRKVIYDLARLPSFETLPDKKDQFDETTGYRTAKTFPSDTRMIPSLQLVMGFAWRKVFGALGLKVFANWELNMWDDLSQTYMYPTTTADASSLVGSWVRNSVNIQGITAGFAAEF
jgi:hypothetical protein